MLNLKNNKQKYNIPEEKISKIEIRDKTSWIRIYLKDDLIDIFYDKEKDYKTDKEKCQKWINNIKPIIEENKDTIKTIKIILNALDTLKQVCEQSVDDCESCPFRIEDMDIASEIGSLCFFEIALPPSLWHIIEPANPKDNTPLLEGDYYDFPI